MGSKSNVSNPHSTKESNDDSNNNNNNATKPNWIDLINESVHSGDDHDVGDIEAVNRDFLVVKRGFVHVHRYYVPMNRVEGWDGKVVWLKVSEQEVKQNYERDRIPDLDNYYIKDQPNINKDRYDLSYFSINLPSIPPKYREEMAYVIAPKEEHTPYRCDLCEDSFKTEDELSDHVKLHH